MMSTVYAIPNFECNLSCPHCDIKDRHLEYDREKFIASLKTFSRKSTSIVLFGGEPTLYKDRFLDIISQKIATSISTNLVTADSDILSALVNDSKLQIATSWNMTRFNAAQEEQWLKNLSLFSDTQKKCLVLITMTPDLIYDQKSIIFHILDKIAATNGVSDILFEHLISDKIPAHFHNECDDWLCMMHNTWRWSTLKNKIEEKVKENKWKFECSSTYTLLPNGVFQNGCPQKSTPVICTDCLTCKNAIYCQPCSLQRFCTFPKKLYELLSKSA